MNVLISGAGVAGSTVAYWLARHGIRVTVVECASGQRSSGNPVDIKGSAVGVVEQMGIMPQLQAAATRAERLVFVDADGHERVGVNMKAFQGSAGDREVEIGRADLAAILLSAARGSAEMRYGDAITGLAQDGNGVDVTFERSEPEHFDLVVGADGVHSTVRRLAFGPEAGFVRHMGMYVAVARWSGENAPALPVDRSHDDAQIIFNTPGHAFAARPGSEKPAAAFIFRHRGVPGFDYRDLESHKRLVTQEYAGRLGGFAGFLDRIHDADDLYFDSVSRVRPPLWSTGRVTLVGDAASSLSLFGDGSTLAVVGAHTLAEELARTPGDLPAALFRYEQRHRRLTKQRQRGIFTASAMLLVPRTRAGIAVRNAAVRFLGR